MNCQEFNEHLFEYLDEALPTNLQATAREHLQLCADCQRALEREKVMAQSIEKSLNLATFRFSMSSELRRKIVLEPQARRMAPGILDLFREWFTLKSIRFAVATATLLVSLSLFVALYNNRRPAANSSPTAALNKQEIYVIDVPFHTQTHLSQQQDGGVVDTIASSAAVGHAILFEPIH